MNTQTQLSVKLVIKNSAWNAEAQGTIDAMCEAFLDNFCRLQTKVFEGKNYADLLSLMTEKLNKSFPKLEKMVMGMSSEDIKKKRSSLLKQPELLSLSVWTQASKKSA